MPRPVSVVLDIPSRSIATPFTYAVPDELAQSAQVGCGVLVEFGHRMAVGWIVGHADEGTDVELKPLVDVLTESRFDSVAVETARWIATEYCAPVSDALRLWLPSGTVPRVERFTDGDGEVHWRLKEPAVGTVDERWVSRVPGSEYEPAANAHVQRAILDAVAAGPVSVAELRADLGGVSSALKRLNEVGAVEIVERRRFRLEHAAEAAPGTPPVTLSDGQRDALAAVTESAAGEVVLMHGITGSGKTEVYLRGIEHVLARGQAAIVLVPEISLTPQAVGRFRSRFGDTVAVFHSRLGAGERLDEWDRVRLGDARVVVGARSALFAPVSDPGLIIIDEEHSSSYKQGSAPRYDARDVAVQIARRRGCPVVMGSATPSMERLVQAERAEIRMVLLPDRVGGGRLPDVTVVDMTTEFDAGNRSMFSRPLSQALLENAENRERSVLLLNRRGYAAFLLCRECGYVPTCDSCSTSLTFHEEGTGVLACHHCGARRRPPTECPECGSPYLRRFGAGTQRVERELAELLPDTPIVRMDADTTKGKGGHERVLAQFEAVPGSVLIGTQMVAKGLDYPDVTLVGVLNADTTLRLPDFRSGERTYQLLAQVAGRAGRSDAGGRVVIQTYWPDNPAIQAAATHDAQAFYEAERGERQVLGYPPYGRLANLVLSGPKAQVVEQAAFRVAEELRAAAASSQLSVVGPSPAPLSRVKGAYRWHLLLKGGQLDDLGTLLGSVLERVGKIPGVSFAPDVDPQDVL